MRRGFSKALAVVALGLALAGASSAAAQDDAKGKDSGKEKRKAAQVDQLTGKRLNEALELLRMEKFEQARAVLAKLQGGRLSPYEVSRVEQILASVDQSQEKYGAAREHLKKALESGGLNDTEMLAVRYQIGQLFIQEEKWKEGIAALKEWFAVAPNPNSAAYYLLAIAYYQLNDYGAAVEPAQKAVDLSEKPQEGWLQLLLALRIEREEYKLAIPLLKRLITASPGKKNYWVQLSSVHAALGNYQDAVVPMQIAYTGGLLTEERDIKRLAELLRQVDIPYRAAQILSKGFEQNQIKAELKTYELLGNCWIAAREYAKSIQPLERAADLADTGDLYVRLAEVLVQREDWENAAKALNRGLEKGKLKNSGNAQLLLGIAFYNQKKPKEARPWFERARNDSSSRGQADSWLKQIELDSKS